MTESPHRFEVTTEDTALALGSGEVEVLATPRLLAWIEHATVAAARSRLAAGQTAVGTAVRLRHRKPSAVGEHITVHAEIADNAGANRLNFTVRAENENGETVADGEIDRAVVKRSEFEPR